MSQNIRTYVDALIIEVNLGTDQGNVGNTHKRSDQRVDSRVRGKM